MIGRGRGAAGELLCNVRSYLLEISPQALRDRDSSFRQSSGSRNTGLARPLSDIEGAEYARVDDPSGQINNVIDMPRNLNGLSLSPRHTGICRHMPGTAAFGEQIEVQEAQTDCYSHVLRVHP